MKCLFATNVQEEKWGLKMLKVGKDYIKNSISHIFEVNLHHKINIRISNHHKIVYIDNFYKRPHLVREFLLKTPAIARKNMLTNPENYLIGSRAVIDFKDKSAVWECIYHLIVKEFDIDPKDLDYENRFISNIYAQFDIDDDTELLKKQYDYNMNPHFDQCMAATVWLNTKDECNGGTAFYRNTRYNASDLLDLDDYDHYMEIKKEYIKGVTDDWEVIDMLEMKYNRMYIYNACRYHNPYIEDNWFKDCYRISQQFFFDIDDSKLYKNFKRWI